MDYKEFERQVVGLRDEWKKCCLEISETNILQILDRNDIDNIVKSGKKIIKILPKIKEFMNTEIETLYNLNRNIPNYFEDVNQDIEDVKNLVNKIL